MRAAVVPRDQEMSRKAQSRDPLAEYIYMYYNPAAALGDTHHSPITVPACIMMVPRCDPARSVAHLTGGGGQRKTPIAAALRCTPTIQSASHDHCNTLFALFCVCALITGVATFPLWPALAFEPPANGNFKGCIMCIYERRTPVACF
jgi:hypothetical protein